MKIFLLADGAGELADGAGNGLAEALAALGHEVRVAVPKGGRWGQAGTQPRQTIRVAVPHVGGAQLARIETSQIGKVTRHYIAGGPPWRAAEGARAAFFSLAALGLCCAEGWAPDVVHATSALAGPALYWLAAARRYDDFFKQTRTVFAIGDLARGRGGEAAALLAYGLAPSDAALLPDWARATPAGLALAHADWLSADGPTRVRELLTTAGGQGFEGLLAARRDRLAGILEGLEVEAWDPAKDRALRARYDESTLARRARNKRALQKELGLRTAADTPLVAVPWLEEDEAAVEATEQLLADPSPAENVQIVVLGTKGVEKGRRARALARRHRGQVAVAGSFSMNRLRRVYGGADMLVAAGPAGEGGLSYRLGLRYGAPPVAWRWGSAADLLVEGGRRGNGFGFADYNAASLLAAVRRALGMYGQPARWQAMQRRGMQQARQWGWERTARTYLALYQQVLAGREDP